MRALLNERLKDAIIDYIYDYCFNEKVKKIEGASIKLQLDPDYDYSKDEVTQALQKTIIHSKGPFSMRYEVRNNDFCEIATENSVHTSFLDRLERIEISRKSVTPKQINNTIQFLVDKSYLIRDQPIKTKLKLSDKAIYHYENGQSFEQRYNDRYFVRKANIISLLSLIIAAIALIISILI
jgi:hypothetical protein